MMHLLSRKYIIVKQLSNATIFNQSSKKIYAKQEACYSPFTYSFRRYDDKDKRWHDSLNVSLFSRTLLKNRLLAVATRGATVGTNQQAGACDTTPAAREN